MKFPKGPAKLPSRQERGQVWFVQVRRKSSPPSTYTCQHVPGYVSSWVLNVFLQGCRAQKSFRREGLCTFVFPGSGVGFALCEGTHCLNLRVCFSWCRPHLFACASISLTCGPPIPWSVFSCAQENVVAGQACRNRMTAGKRPRTQRRRKKEIEFKHNSLKNEYTLRKRMYFWKY